MWNGDMWVHSRDIHHFLLGTPVQSTLLMVALRSSEVSERRQHSNICRSRWLVSHQSASKSALTDTQGRESRVRAERHCLCCIVKYHHLVERKGVYSSCEGETETSSLPFWCGNKFIHAPSWFIIHMWCSKAGDYLGVGAGNDYIMTCRVLKEEWIWM